MPRWMPSLCLLTALTGPAVATDLVRDGKPVAVLAVPPNPDDAEKLAARELTSHLEQMAGAKLPTITTDPKDLDAFLERSRQDGIVPIVLGRAALPRLEKLLKARSDRPGTFALLVARDHILIGGLENGTAFGVSELLEQLGVRWFMPGDLGTVIPRNRNVAVAEQQTVQVPSFATRWFQMPDRDWQVRLRCGGPTFPSAHGLPGVPKFTAEPELYSLVNGKRTPRQHCLTNPRLLEAVVSAVKAQRARGRHRYGAQ